jgi:hypothetical protein
MATIKVKYLVEMTQEIEWPDDELDNLDYVSLVCNCDPCDDYVSSLDFDIQEVTLNGKNHDF